MGYLGHSRGSFGIGEPGGPAGPFCSIVNQEGKVIAMQIPKQADAALLAAAPEMMDACRAMRDYMEKRLPEQGDRYGHGLRNVYDHAKKALAKYQDALQDVGEIPEVALEEPGRVTRCPICEAVMVPSRHECEDGSGWTFGWACDCTEGLRDAYEGPGELFIHSRQVPSED